jgi:hypothetical protein
MIGAQWVDLHWSVESAGGKMVDQNKLQFALVVTSQEEAKAQRVTLHGSRCG